MRGAGFGNPRDIGSAEAAEMYRGWFKNQISSKPMASRHETTWDCERLGGDELEGHLIQKGASES